VLLQAVQFDGSREDYIFHVPVKDFLITHDSPPSQRQGCYNRT
jgi:hypothetical protein